MDPDWDVSEEWSDRRRAEFLRESANRDPWVFEYESELQRIPRRPIYASVKIEDLSGLVDLSASSWPHWDRIEDKFITTNDMSEMIRRRGPDLTMYDFLTASVTVDIQVVGYQVWTPTAAMGESLITISMLTPLPACPTEIMFPRGFYRLHGELHPNLPPNSGVRPAKPVGRRSVPVTFSTQPLRKMIEPAAWDGVESWKTSMSSRLGRMVRRNSRALDLT
jgi:hypothetical protein